MFSALTLLDAPPAQAAGSPTASSALQISVQVIYPCAVDTSVALEAPRFDAAARQAVLLAARASLATSCGEAQTRVELVDARLTWVDVRDGVPRLDVEF